MSTTFATTLNIWEPLLLQFALFLLCYASALCEMTAGLQTFSNHLQVTATRNRPKVAAPLDCKLRNSLQPWSGTVQPILLGQITTQSTIINLKMTELSSFAPGAGEWRHYGVTLAYFFFCKIRNHLVFSNFDGMLYHHQISISGQYFHTVRCFGSTIYDQQKKFNSKALHNLIAELITPFHDLITYNRCGSYYTCIIPNHHG